MSLFVFPGSFYAQIGVMRRVIRSGYERFLFVMNTWIAVTVLVSIVSSAGLRLTIVVMSLSGTTGRERVSILRTFKGWRWFLR